MKFFISKTKKLKNKFGNWYFWHDKKVKSQSNSDSLILYHGYTINDSIENYLTDFNHLQEQDGNFFAIKITQDKLSQKDLLDHDRYVLNCKLDVLKEIRI